MRTMSPGARPPIARKWELKLYLAGQTAKSLLAFSNLKRICEDHLSGEYRLRNRRFDAEPATGGREIRFSRFPTLARKLPEPVRKIIGDLSDAERVLVGLDLRQPEAGV